MEPMAADTTATEPTAPASTPATAPATAPASTPDAFVQKLIDGFNALTPEEKEAIKSELSSAMAAAENTNVVKGTNESLRSRFNKLTNENIEWWLNSFNGRNSNQRIREAAIYELKRRKAIKS
jgi:hypothetical protein